MPLSRLGRRHLNVALNLRRSLSFCGLWDPSWRTQGRELELGSGVVVMNVPQGSLAEKAGLVGSETTSSGEVNRLSLSARGALTRLVPSKPADHYALNRMNRSCTLLLFNAAGYEVWVARSLFRANRDAPPT